MAWNPEVAITEKLYLAIILDSNHGFARAALIVSPCTFHHRVARQLSMKQALSKVWWKGNTILESNDFKATNEKQTQQSQAHVIQPRRVTLFEFDACMRPKANGIQPRSWLQFSHQYQLMKQQT